MRKKIKLNKIEIKHKLIILVFLAIALIASCFFSGPIENALGIGEVSESGAFVGVDVVNNSNMVVHYIDVKQADCTFIELPDGKTMLIDSGDMATADDVVKYITAVLGESKTIDYFVLTHSDSDHVGGAPAIFDAFEIKNIYRPFALAGKYSNKDTTALENFTCNTNEDLADLYNYMLNNETLKANAKKLPRVKTDIYNKVVEKIYSEQYANNTQYASVCVNYDSLTIISEDELNPYEIEFYAPLRITPTTPIDSFTNHTTGYVTKGYGATNAEGYNAISPVIRIEYQNNKFLFTGDIYENAETEVVESLESQDREELSNITVYQAGHHGAKNSNTQELLNLINPKYTVVSSNNKGNDYNHPSEEFLKRLKKLNHEVTDYLLRTDQQGTIVFGVDDTGNVSYAANVQVTQAIFAVRWWQIAVGIFIVATVVLFNIKYPSKTNNKRKKA